MDRSTLIIVVLVACAPFVMWGGLTLLGGRDAFWPRLLGEFDRTTYDFAAAGRDSRPNQVLVCPPKYCASEPDFAAPIYRRPLAEVRDAWLSLLSGEPRVRWLSGLAEDAQFVFEIRTRVLRFPDIVTLHFIPLGDGQTTLAIHSRASYGYYDFGTNARRVRGWLSRANTLLETPNRN